MAFTFAPIFRLGVLALALPLFSVPFAASDAVAQSMMNGTHGMMGSGSEMMGSGMMGSTMTPPHKTLPSPSSPALSPQLQQGQSLYQDTCAACHGATGAGGQRLSGAISAPLQAPALETKYHHSDQALKQAIMAGVNAKGQPLAAAMPRFDGSLSGTQADQIIAYLKHLHR